MSTATLNRIQSISLLIITINYIYCVCAHMCMWLPAEQEAHRGKVRKDDNDGMCWHVPLGGFGVAVI